MEPDLNRVSSDTRTEKLEPMAMALLVHLAENQGTVVTREQLHTEVWGHEFVSDSTVSSAVTVVRKTLGDDARNPRYIETIPKRGYRLIADVFEADGVSTVTPFPRPSETPAGSPYPGLSAFTESDVEHFFGRTREAVTLWEKTLRRKLLAVIGPSGTGKTSFIRAGLIPEAPDGWDTVVFEPGAAPFAALTRALLPKFAGDSAVVEQLVGSHDPDVVFSLVSRWRGLWSNVLLVGDQFEELFTLSPPEVRKPFADLLARLASAADVHVVLALRDDFLYECHAHPGLVPVFNDLTVLGPLAPADLRQALVEPARQRGYSFEADTLVAEIVEGTAGERGAMPLLAFAASKLWEMRDRETRMITSVAYERIGGVGGALAQHAEQVLRGIGDDGLPLVREIFRNLLTGAGTRAAREVGELLTIFAPDRRQAATDVLQRLINGRLLTAFEDETGGEQTAGDRCRVEIVHESLLTHWPRLVRWQAQDAEGVQLRQELRQAARTWIDHDRPDDLLWTGTAFREYLLWREHYPGGLTDAEKDFAQAMVRLAGRKRRRRRYAVAVSLIAGLTLSAVMTSLWWAGVREARRADAKQLFMKGKVNLEYYPVGSFSDAVASLEMVDDPEVRRFALEALWRTPMPVQVLWTDSDPVTSVDFSPDGNWFAAGYTDGSVRIWSAGGGDPVTCRVHRAPVGVLFAPDSSLLAVIGIFDATYQFLSVPEGRPTTDREQGSWRPILDVGDNVALGSLRRLLRFARRPEDDPTSWTIDSRTLERTQELQAGETGPAATDPAGERLVIAKGRSLYVADTRTAAPRLLARHHESFEQIAMHPDADRVATIDSTGQVQLWSLSGEADQPIRHLTGNRRSVCWDLDFDPTGRLLASTHESGRIQIWALNDPPGAEPMDMVGSWARGVDLDFEPGGHWLAIGGGTGIGVWPIDRGRFGYVLRGHSGSVEQLSFSADGTALISAGIDGTVRVWPIRWSPGERDRVLCRVERPMADIAQFAVPLHGDFVAIPTCRGTVQVRTMDGRIVRELEGFRGRAASIAVSPDGRLVAAGGGPPDPADAVIRVWNLQTGEVEVLNSGDGAFIGSLGFSDSTRLLATGGGILYRWDLPGGRRQLVLDEVQRFALSRNGTTLVALRDDQSAWVHNLETGTSVALKSHGDELLAVTVTADGRTVVTGGHERIVRAGPADDAEPHLLYGHRAMVKALAVSPDGRWIASGSRDGTVRLWPMPHGQPFHTLARAELLDRLHALRSYRRVPSNDTMRGFIDEPIPFRGWKSTTTW